MIAAAFLAPILAAAVNAIAVTQPVQLGTAAQIDHHGTYVNGDRLAQLEATVAGVTYNCIDIPADHPAWDPCHARNYQGLKFGVRW